MNILELMSRTDEYKDYYYSSKSLRSKNLFLSLLRQLLVNIQPYSKILYSILPLVLKIYNRTTTKGYDDNVWSALVF